MNKELLLAYKRVFDYVHGDRTTIEIDDIAKVLFLSEQFIEIYDKVQYVAGDKCEKPKTQRRNLEKIINDFWTEWEAP
jgi:hypothetical protein